MWRSRAEDPNYFHVVPKSTPALDASRLYAGSDDGTFRALDQESGTEGWRVHIDDPRRKGILLFPRAARGAGLLRRLRRLRALPRLRKRRSRVALFRSRLGRLLAGAGDRLPLHRP